MQVRADSVQCHGSKCPLLTAFFSLSSSAGLLFSQKGLSYCSEILHGVLSRKKIRLWEIKKNWGTPQPPGG